MIANDLSSLFGGGQNPGVGFRQGTVLTWNPTTGANTIKVAGATLENVALMGVTATAIHAGDHVGLLTADTSWFIVGKISDPGDSVIPTWTTDIATAQGTANAAVTNAAAAQAAANAASLANVHFQVWDGTGATPDRDTARTDIKVLWYSPVTPSTAAGKAIAGLDDWVNTTP